MHVNQNLVRRLTEATKPDRLLDAEIALSVGHFALADGGRTILRGRAFYQQKANSTAFTKEEAIRAIARCSVLPFYSKSLDAALSTLDLSVIHFTIDSRTNTATVTRPDGTTASATSFNLPAALLLASMKQ